MTKVVTIDNATFDVAKLTQFMQRAHNLLDEQQVLKEDYKQLVSDVEQETKLPKKVVNKFFKSRFADKTKEVVKEGSIFEALNEAVDN